MSIPLEALLTAGAAAFGSLMLYTGARVNARSTKAVEDRKVNLTEFEAFKKAYQERMEEFQVRYDHQEAKMNKVERFLRLALKHILDLRADMRQHDVNPTHRTPPELERLLWTLSDDDDEPMPPQTEQGD